MPEAPSPNKGFGRSISNSFENPEAFARQILERRSRSGSYKTTVIPKDVEEDLEKSSKDESKDNKTKDQAKSKDKKKDHKHKDETDSSSESSSSSD